MFFVTFLRQGLRAYSAVTMTLPLLSGLKIFRKGEKKKELTVTMTLPVLSGLKYSFSNLGS